MKLEDMKVGAFVKCTKPEWDCYKNSFKITDKFSDNKWELTKNKSDNTESLLKSVVSQETLQHNFKLDKSFSAALKPKKKIDIEIYKDGKTFAEGGGKIVHVSLYHDDKYDEFVGAVEALAKFYGRKSPFDEIEELKDIARAAAQPIEAIEVSDEWSTVEKEEEPKPHSPVDDMDLTPPLEEGCLVEVLKPQVTETGEDVTGAWQYVYFLEDGGKFKDKEGFPRKDLEGITHAVVNDIAKIDRSEYYWYGLPFSEKEVKVVKERYRDIWPEDATYKFGGRVFLNDKSYSSNRKCRGTVFDCKKSNGRTYYHVHWDKKNVHRRCEEEWVEEISLRPSLY